MLGLERFDGRRLQVDLLLEQQIQLLLCLQLESQLVDGQDRLPLLLVALGRGLRGVRRHALADEVFEFERDFVLDLGDVVLGFREKLLQALDLLVLEGEEVVLVLHRELKTSDAAFQVYYGALLLRVFRDQCLLDAQCSLLFSLGLSDLLEEGGLVDLGLLRCLDVDLLEVHDLLRQRLDPLLLVEIDNRGHRVVQVDDWFNHWAVLAGQRVLVTASDVRLVLPNLSLSGALDQLWLAFFKLRLVLAVHRLVETLILQHRRIAGICVLILHIKKN